MQQPLLCVRLTQLTGLTLLLPVVEVASCAFCSGKSSLCCQQLSRVLVQLL